MTMLKRMFKMVAALMCVATVSIVTAEKAEAQSIVWGYYNGSQKLASWGTSKGETYYVGMKVDDASLVGGKVTSVKVPLNITTVTGCKVWIAKGELKSDSGKGVSDDVCVDFTPTDTWTEVALPEPYAIDEEPFFVGVSFTTTATEFSPMLLMQSSQTETTYIKSSRTYRKWTDMGVAPGACLPLLLTVSGNAVQDDAVSVVRMNNVFAKHGEPAQARVTVANNGKNAVESVDWKYTVAGQSVSGHNEVHISADYYGAQESFLFDVPAIAENGEYEGVFTVTKVNGQDNNASAASASNIVKVMNVVPKKVPLMEEFTGTWCGFCPSGYIGMKLMNERHPGEFVCASYHNGDAMQITTNYPVQVDGFPAANIDRNHPTDAYGGDVRNDMGIDLTWQLECLEIPALNVGVNGNVTTDNGVLTVKSNYTFCKDIEGANFGIAYIITADGLHGTGGSWRQHNYFSVDYEGGAYSGMYQEGMDMFNNGPEYQYLVYDDVVIATSCAGNGTIDGIIPADCKDGEVVSHTMTFNIADMATKQGGNLVQDVNRLNVIALAYNKTTGHVENCAKAHVAVDDLSGIVNISTSEKADACAYSIAGQRVGDNYKGVVIRNGKKVMQ